MSDLGYVPHLLTIVNCDNQSAIAFTKNLKYHSKSKHIEIQFHYIHEKTINGEIKILQ
jgi:hypothetical protein